jgi:hypothetical protein
LIGRSTPDWLNEFDIADELKVKVWELGEVDSIYVSRAIARINIRHSVESGHFKPLTEEEIDE